MSWSESRPGLLSGRTPSAGDNFNRGHSVTFSSVRSSLDPAAAPASLTGRRAEHREEEVGGVGGVDFSRQRWT